MSAVVAFENSSPSTREQACSLVADLQFERTDLSLFRNPVTLAQKAGVPQSSLLKLAFKELADNALDAGGRVGFEHDGVLTWVKDDGPGIGGTDEEVAAMFSVGRPLRSSKLLRLPTRGALGNGLRVVVGLVLCTGGRLVVRTRGRELELRPHDNGDTLVTSSKPWSGTGTQVGVSFGRVDDDMLDWAQVAADAIGVDGYKGASSPYWYDSDSFFELCAASAPGLYVRALIERLDGCSGAKAGKIAAPFLNRLARDLTRDEADTLLLAARQQAREVTPKRLGTVGGRLGFPGYGKASGAIAVSGRKAGRCRAEIPVVVEAWARAGSPGARVLVNRTPSPAAANAHSYDRHVVFVACGYSGEHLPSGGHEYTIEINVQTPHMPITSDGKTPDLARFKSLLNQAIRQAVVRAKMAEGILRNVPTGERRTFKSSILAHLHEAIAMASGDGKYRYNQRNLFYQVRPFVMREVGKLAYPTFTSFVTDYENDYGPIAGMYRSERGFLIHPHTREQIPLGTLSVEKYQRPPFVFNKLLYIEKSGSFEMLCAAGFPEQYDCALVTSQGYASRAARDLIDALSDTDEPITIFCAHDADAYGTKIFESLQEATKARPERKVKVINIGLERGEAEAMGLEFETLPESEKEKPTAAYVSREDHVWYQTHRYELNAMTAPQHIAWLGTKMEEHGDWKVVPPDRVMKDRLESDARQLILEYETERVLREANLDALVEKKLVNLRTQLAAAAETLVRAVPEKLEESPEDLWSDVIGRMAQELVELGAA